MSKVKFPSTDDLLEALPEVLKHAGLAGVSFRLNADEDDFDDSTDDEISFVDEDGRSIPFHIQSGPYGASVNREHYDADGELEAITPGTAYGPIAVVKVAVEAAKAIAEYRAESSAPSRKP